MIDQARKASATIKQALPFWRLKGYFPLGGIFRAERHFLLLKDQLAESRRQKTKENIIPRGKFRLVENDPKWKKNTLLFTRIHSASYCRKVMVSDFGD